MIAGAGHATSGSIILGSDRFWDDLSQAGPASKRSRAVDPAVDRVSSLHLAGLPARVMTGQVIAGLVPSGSSQASPA